MKRADLRVLEGLTGFDPAVRAWLDESRHELHLEMEEAIGERLLVLQGQCRALKEVIELVGDARNALDRLRQKA